MKHGHSITKTIMGEMHRHSWWMPNQLMIVNPKFSILSWKYPTTVGKYWRHNLNYPGITPNVKQMTLSGLSLRCTDDSKEGLHSRTRDGDVRSDSEDRQYITYAQSVGTGRYIHVP